MESIGRLKVYGAKRLWAVLPFFMYACGGSNKQIPLPMTHSSPSTAQYYIQGKVTNAADLPLEGVTVAIVEGSASFPDMAAVTSSDGIFRFSPISNGEYTLQAFGPDGRGTKAKVAVRDSNSTVNIRLE